MTTTDKRMLHLIDILKHQKLIKNQEQFCEEVGTIRQTIYKIRKGNSRFTLEQVFIACKKHNVNANWVFGTQNNVFNTAGSIEFIGL